MRLPSSPQPRRAMYFSYHIASSVTLDIRHGYSEKLLHSWKLATGYIRSCLNKPCQKTCGRLHFQTA